MTQYIGNDYKNSSRPRSRCPYSYYPGMVDGGCLHRWLPNQLDACAPAATLFGQLCVPGVVHQGMYFQGINRNI